MQFSSTFKPETNLRSQNSRILELEETFYDSYPPVLHGNNLSQVKLLVNRRDKTSIYGTDLESGSVQFPHHQVYQLGFSHRQTTKNSTGIDLISKGFTGQWDREV